MNKNFKFSVAVLGAGIMGQQIVSLFASKGINVTLWNHREIDEIKKDKLESSIEQQANKLNLNSGKVEYTCDLKDISNIDIIFEAVAESLKTKEVLYSKLNNLIKETSIIATNTSSLPLDVLSKFLTNKKNFVGFHFFNPIKVMNFAEIIYINETSNDTKKIIENALDLSNLQYSFVPNIPGYVVNRLLFVLISESLRILERCENEVSINDIDKAMKLGAAHPMGPFKLADFIGLDVCLDIFKNLYKYSNEDIFKPSEILIDYVKKNKLGRKTGEGFYSYDRKR